MKNINWLLLAGLGISLYFNWAAVKGLESGQLKASNDPQSTRLLSFWHSLNSRISKVTVSSNLRKSFKRDYPQALAALPNASSIDGSGGFSKWMTVANQYAKALNLAPFKA